MIVCALIFSDQMQCQSKKYNIKHAQYNIDVCLWDIHRNHGINWKTDSWVTNILVEYQVGDVCMINIELSSQVGNILNLAIFLFNISFCIFHLTESDTFEAKHVITEGIYRKLCSTVNQTVCALVPRSVSQYIYSVFIFCRSLRYWLSIWYGKLSGGITD